MHIEDNLRAGMSPEEARRLAIIKLGGVAQIKELHREQRGLPMLETLWRDLRFGVRMLAKKPGFTLVAILTLALRIDAKTAAIRVVDSRQPTADSLTLKPIVFQVRDKQKVEAEAWQLRVPEKRGRGRAKMITLAFVRFKSTAPQPASPIVYLAGGPGDSGIINAALLHSLPFTEAKWLVMIWQTDTDIPRDGPAFPDFADTPFKNAVVQIGCGKLVAKLFVRVLENSQINWSARLRNIGINVSVLN